MKRGNNQMRNYLTIEEEIALILTVKGIEL